MTTIALIGPDGAGKTTAARQLAQQLPIPTRYIYMGVGLEASALVLPTTRLVVAWKRRRGRRPALPPAAPGSRREGGAAPTAPARVKATLRMANWAGEAWLRQLVAWVSEARGEVVIFDRHFAADYCWAITADEDGTASAGRRLFRSALRRLPAPDVTVVLDVPASVAFERKGESTLDALERRRLAYRRFAEAQPYAIVLDGTRPVDELVEEMARVVTAVAHRRTRPVPGATDARHGGGAVDVGSTITGPDGEAGGQWS